jgi:hypothetical protein
MDKKIQSSGIDHNYCYKYLIILIKYENFNKAQIHFIAKVSDNNHFWVGADCRVLNPEPNYPNEVNSASDIITVTGDRGNRIPNKSWMLYLFEFFIDTTEKIPLELDLTCSFNNDGKFDAIFGGHNQYQFKKILPVVGHSYVREIIVNPTTRIINYQLTDLNTGGSESFELEENNIKDYPASIINNVKFEGSDHFTGLEWWNMAEDSPYPIRYDVMVSLLQYGKHDLSSSDPRRSTYHPYNSLEPDQDQNSKQYPILFQNSRVMKGCICYNVIPGNSSTGLQFSF